MKLASSTFWLAFITTLCAIANTPVSKGTFYLEVTSVLDELDLSRPFSIAYDGTNKLIFDINSCSVFEYDENHKLIRTFGGRGQGPGEFVGPSYLSLDEGQIYVYDYTQRKLNRFDRQGKFLDAKMLVANVVYSKYWKGHQYTIFTSGAGRSLSIANREGKHIRDLTLKHRSKYTIFVSTAFDDQGNVYCGLFDKYMIEVYDPNGIPIREISLPYHEIGPFHHKDIRRDIMLPVITGLQATKDYLFVLVGGMQRGYEQITGKKLDDPNYLTHIDIFDLQGKFVDRVWHEEITSKSNIFGPHLFSVDRNNVIWVAPEMGELFRCELKRLKNAGAQ